MSNSTVDRPSDTCALKDAAYNERWIERVKAKCIVNENGCWIWQGFCHPFRNMKPGQRGYPGGAYGSKSCRVHRRMLEVKLGKLLPTEIQACHTCDTPPCCNPDHMYPATNQQNHLDGAKRKRMQGQNKTQCVHGHEYTPENTYLDQRPGGGGSRHCRMCARIRLAKPESRRRSAERGRERRQELRAKKQESSHVG
jgi:hypothetical protein